MSRTSTTPRQRARRAALSVALATAGSLLLTAPAGAAPQPRPADLPFTTYEVEDGSTDGSVLAPDRTYLTPASEASGRRAVVLRDTGQYAEVKLTAPANALNLRYSLPDSADGKGQDATLSVYADGKELTDLDLTSKYSWVYGGYPYTNNPSDGSAHRFFDESRTRLDQTLPAGTVLRFQKDAGDSAASYTLDLVEAEDVAGPGSMPEGYVSATGLGVTPDDGQDDTSALNSAVQQAKQQGKGLWLPAGTYVLSDRVDLPGVALRGAGVWDTVLRGTGLKGGLYATGGTTAIRDLMIDGDNTVRDDAGGQAAIEGVFADGSALDNVWIRHTKVGLWANGPTTGLTVSHLRIRDTYADGVNLHGDVRDTVVSDSSVRGTGDDGLAMWSEGAPVTDSVFRDNTVQLPLLANGAAVYGGSGNRVENNTISDTVTGSAGIAVSSRFGDPFTGTTTVSGNTLDRTGGYEPNWQSELGALWVYAANSDITTPVVLSDNTVRDSTYSGLLVSYQKTVGDLSVEDTTFDGAGTHGIEIDAAGSGTFSGVDVSGTGSDALSLSGGFTVTRGSGNSGW